MMKNYDEFIDNAKYYLDKDLHFITNLANISAYIFQEINDINWAGFYLYDGEKLYLGPFQGKPACTNIKMGAGVCGTSAVKRETLVVPDVHEFPGHIACDCASKSEVVFPIITKSGDLFAVLDIDSPIVNRFDEKTVSTLQKVANLIVDIL